MSTRTSVNAANQDYDKLTDVNAVTPSAPVHAARLNGLLKTLANAEGAVTESIKARNVLIRDLEQILKSQHDVLATEETQLRQLSERRAAIDAKKKDVEDAIMRGFATNSNPSTPAQDNATGQSHSPVTPGTEPDRPEVEALTPPTQSPLSPDRDTQQTSDPDTQPKNSFTTIESRQTPAQPPSASPSQQTPAANAHAGLDLLASLSSGAYQTQYSSNRNGSAAKKRKLDARDDFPDLGGDAMDDIDDDVAEMLRGGGS
jgi:regulator of Ty1 transposition protein 103